MPSWPTKDPDALLDYYVKWVDWLKPGETIVTSTWTINEGTVMLAPPPAEAVTGGWLAIKDGWTSTWLEGGTLGEICDITNHIVTSEGREDDRTGKLRIRKR